MFWVALSLLAQTFIPTQANWIGTMEVHDSRGLVLVPTRATLTITSGVVDGDWRSLPNGNATGHIHGTIDDKGRFTWTVTFYSGAEEAGQVIAAERCHAETTAKGELTKTGVLRWTAKKFAFDDVIKRAENRHCEDATDVIWTMHTLH